jgi:hypothetical protein
MSMMEASLKIERETTLSQAVEAVSTLLAQMRDSRITVGDRQVGMDDAVTLEFEIESSSDKLELEFEIKWRKPSAAAASASESPAMAETSSGWHHG